MVKKTIWNVSIITKYPLIPCNLTIDKGTKKSIILNVLFYLDFAKEEVRLY